MIKQDNAPKTVASNLVDKIIAKYRGKSGEVLAILEEVQQLHENKYLPKATLEYISKKISITLSQLYSVVTFYSFFNLEPQGKHSIQVCRGTACHSKNSKRLLEALYALLGIKEHMLKAHEGTFFTTEDHMFTVRIVACFGQCALSPVIVVDERIYTNMTVEKLKKLVSVILRSSAAKRRDDEES